MTSFGLATALPADENELARRVLDVEKRVAQQAAARTLDAATIGSGGLVVKDSGSISVNPDGTSIALRTYGAPGTEQISALEFASADKSLAATPARILLVDSGAGSLLEMTSIPNAAGDTAYVSVAGSGGAQMSANSPSTGKGVTFYVNAGASSPAAEQASATISGLGSAFMFHGSAIDIGGVRLFALDTTSPEWRCQTNGGTYVPIRAASFPVGSSRAVKTDIAPIPFDVLAAIEAAKPMQWRYSKDFAEDPVAHISPMAEDLPADLVAEVDGVKTVDLTSLVGTLWEAVGQLSARIRELESKVAQ